VSTVWRWTKDFGRFWYHFLVGDDWTIAAGVGIALLATYGLVQSGVSAWWVLPFAAVGVLVFSVVRANRRA
jgi:hypothetical protein